MFGAWHSGLEMLLAIIKSFVVSIFILRWFLQLFRASYINPICQAIYKFTQPVIKLIAKIIPRKSRADWPLLFSIYLLANIFQGLQFLLLPGKFDVTVCLLLALLFCFSQVLNLFFIAIIIRVISSWFATDARQPAMQIIYIFTNPILRPAQRIVPIIGGLDLSPAIVLLLLKCCDWFVIDALKMLVLQLY